MSVIWREISGVSLKILVNNIENCYDYPNWQVNENTCLISLRYDDTRLILLTRETFTTVQKVIINMIF